VGPNHPNAPSNIPGLTNGQVHALLIGLTSPTLGFGWVGVQLGTAYYNSFGGGSSSPWKHRDLGQETHRN
jgi:hypothetical protein